MSKHTRCEQGNLWLLSARSSKKNKNIIALYLRALLPYANNLYHLEVEIRPFCSLFSAQASSKNSSVAKAMQRFFESPGQKTASHLRTHFYFQMVLANEEHSVEGTSYIIFDTAN